MIHPKSFLLACVLALCATQAFAGPLAIDTTSIAGFHGTTPYQGFNNDNTPSGLFGTVDYAVWAPGTWPPGTFTGFSASDYVYTYQLNESAQATAALSSFAVVLTGPTDDTNIGDFHGSNGFGLVAGQHSLGGANAPFIIPQDSANWSFAGIAPGTSSDGLAYSSPNPPTWSSGTAIDDGSVANFYPIPSSSPGNVPEPGTLTLASCGVGVLVFQWLRRRGRKTSL
jgi:hypothetical protein